MNCKNFQHELPELLMNPGTEPSVAAAAHMVVCPPCRQEYREFQATFALLDSWTAPEPTAYFDQKLAVRIREEQAAPPMNWLERMKTRLLFNTGRQFRPALASALALILLVGGGTVAELNIGSGFEHNHTVQASATVDDLQILDRNEQAFQQMDQLLQDDDSGSGPDQAAPAEQPIS
jgi:hypothetical protein